jgi:hypothetical protein
LRARSLSGLSGIRHNQNWVFARDVVPEVVPGAAPAPIDER